MRHNYWVFLRACQSDDMNHADGYDADGGLSMTMSDAPEKGGWGRRMEERYGRGRMSFITRSHARGIDKRRVQGAAECRLLHGHINIINNEQ